MNKDSARKMFGPQLERNLRTRLVNRFKDKYRFMGGEEIIQFIVDDILSLVEEEYRPLAVIKKGQILWDGIKIKQKRKPGRALNMKETRTKPIVLTLISEEDMKKLREGIPAIEIEKDKIERITKEAVDQGTVLNQVDLGLLIDRSRSTIIRYIKEREKEKGIQMPTRGRIHDLGPGVSHKADILRMKKLKKYSILEIKRRTSHSTEAIERYRRDYDRVEMLVPKISPQEIAFVTGMSERLVNEYIKLKHEIDSHIGELGG